MTKVMRLQIGLEHYEFSRFAAIQAGYGNPEKYLEHLLALAFSETPDGQSYVTNSVPVLKNAPCPHNEGTLRRGAKLARLSVSNETWLLAEQHYADYCHFDALDFLHGLLNMALMGVMQDYDMHADRSAYQAWRPYWLQDWLGVVERESEGD